eukprot:TRINITY_DN194_c1_g2_i1.p1 TRINITY_DN194_c1_g2~~TRINITY_DN194_c1_g2_i1.p1  ORF type:complete len:224 (-),score=69.16 TRINITY_DN194_c1_g2_i1:23-694(-)
MGGQQTKLNKLVEKELIIKTKYDGKELRKWYSLFLEEYPNGLITKNEFIVRNMQYCEFGDTDFWGHVFEIIDTDHSNQISFVEWVTLLSCLSRGTVDDKLKFMFELYDSDNSGYIDRNEVTKIIKFLKKIDKVSEPVDDIVEKTFQRLDENNDNKIDLNEFAVGLRRCDSVALNLNVLDDVFVPLKKRTPHNNNNNNDFSEFEQVEEEKVVHSKVINQNILND